MRKRRVKDAEVVTVRLEEIVVGDEGGPELVPRERWRPYLKTALDHPRLLAERKTGLKLRDVETDRLVRDDRGWLRRAG